MRAIAVRDLERTLPDSFENLIRRALSSSSFPDNCPQTKKRKEATITEKNTGEKNGISDKNNGKNNEITERKTENNILFLSLISKG